MTGVWVGERLLAMKISSRQVLLGRILSPRLSQLSGTVLVRGVVSLTHNPRTDRMLAWSVEEEGSGQLKAFLTAIPHLSLLEVREFPCMHYHNTI